MIGSQFKLVSVICRIICNFYFRWLYDCIASIRVYTIYGIACTYISYRHCCCLHDAVLVPPIVALPQRGAFDLNWVVARSHNYANCVDAADKDSNRIESKWIEVNIYLYVCMYAVCWRCLGDLRCLRWAVTGSGGIEPWLLHAASACHAQFEDGRPLAKCPTHLALKRWLFYVFSVIIIVVVMLIFYCCCYCCCCRCRRRRCCCCCCWCCCCSLYTLGLFCCLVVRVPHLNCDISRAQCRVTVKPA